MKLIASTATICLVIGASVFTTQKVIQTEARKTRKSMQAVLDNPLDGGDSIISKIDKLDASLAAITRRLDRIEDTADRKTETDASEIIKLSADVKRKVEDLALQMNTIKKGQTDLGDIQRQMLILNANMRDAVNVINAKEQESATPPQEMLKAMEWMVEKIDAINGYFPPLYTFLGAVYSEGKGTIPDYPSVDMRINEILLMLEKIQEDAKATRKLVTPFTIEPKKRTGPLGEKN